MPSVGLDTVISYKIARCFPVFRYIYLLGLSGVTRRKLLLSLVIIPVMSLLGCLRHITCTQIFSLLFKSLF